ncbi:tripartite motif-containing protein 16-like [Seriola lalandi dorsalis]|uniref:tripartite motif-containing protein 16-like n=1 Tax=Seriola lalandi dorsalis TaxID=1841481 RepID=UPI000C6FA283|nr:tripartite motif-containing protein 16-like [Seriola lalandi dorsalis]
MAQKGVQLDQESISCSVCLDLLKDPVTIPCGHSYCISCIKSFWNRNDEKKIYSCPQCRQTFRPRPVLVKNTMLAFLVEELKKTGLQAAPADHCYAGPEDVACDFCTGRKLKAVKSCLMCLASYCEKHLQPHYDVAPLKKHKLDSEKIFTELIRLMEKRSSDVKQQIRSQQKTEVSRVKELQEKLQQEITELKRKDAELMQLSHTEDHTQFLHNYPSLSRLSESTDSSSINIRPLSYFEGVTAAVSQLRDKLQDILRDTWTNISLTVTEVDVLLSQPEPRTRADFLKYSQEITLDPNTANTYLLLSEGNRKATLMSQQQSYSSHPDRFADYCQVLSRESLSRRCYWEVEWRGGGVNVAVTYKNISRAGSWDECVFGFNDKSLVLHCYKNCYEFWNNNVETPVSGPRSSRVGVYLDHRAGVLSFYSVSETMTLLHRVQTTFTQPLYAGLWLHYCENPSGIFCSTTAELCDLK